MSEKQKLTVAKFGGTSLADAAQFQKVKETIASNEERRVIVVSAPGKRSPEDEKVTDLLLECYELAANGENFEPVLNQVKNRFHGIAEGIGVSFPLEEEFEAIKENLFNDPDQEYAASRGEYLTARIMAEYLGYTFVDPAWCICFEEDGSLDPAMTIRALSASLRPLEHAVIAGFYGADEKGKIHTFSRGGSDITGSLAARAVHADLYENWTDVDGVYAADPKIADSPSRVEYLSYRELRTLSYMGVSVLHSDAVLPVSDLEIPINIRNTNHPDDKGTMIVRKLPAGMKRPITGVAGRKGMSLIQVEKVMVSDGSGFSAIMLDILKQRALPFEMCLTGIDSITLVIRSDLLEPCREDLFAEIRETLNPDYLGFRDHLSMIAVTGERGTEKSDANVRVLDALTEAGIPITTINQGAGKLNLLIGVPEELYNEAIIAISKTINTDRE